MSKHQFFDATDPKFDKYYSNLFISDLAYKNNRLKYIRVIFFRSFLARILQYSYLMAFFIARASYPAVIFNFYYLIKDMNRV